MKNFWKWYNDKYGLAEFKRKKPVDDTPAIQIPIEDDILNKLYDDIDFFNKMMLGYTIPPMFPKATNCRCTDIVFDEDAEVLDFLNELKKYREEEDNESRQD